MVEHKLLNGRLTLQGWSRSVTGTGFYIPELKLALDAGRTDNLSRASHILVTHGHIDHSLQIPWALGMRTLTSSKKTKVFFPLEHLDRLERLIHAASDLDEGSYDYQLIGAEPGQSYYLRNSWRVKVIRVDHRLYSVGYILVEERSRLKEEYKGLQAKELARLSEKHQLTDRIEIPTMAFLGDTTTKTFEWHPELLELPVIITECTFLDDFHRENALQTGHTHWNDLEAIVRSHPRTTFVLTHFSLRYSDYYIREFFRSLPHQPKNVLLCVDH